MSSEPEGFETCSQCMGSGYSGHPDSGALCSVCGGSGGVKPSKQCRSYQDGFTCSYGFVQKPICRGVFGCPHCGRPSDADVPNCMRDELPAHYVNDDGSPRFYRPNRRTDG